MPNTESVVVDVTKTPDALQNLIKDADLVVSLLPYPLHPSIAQQCIRHRTHMLTASYLTAEMKELHSAAAEAGITVMNEVGLDPGIDHLLAMECFDEVRRKGGKEVEIPAGSLLDNAREVPFLPGFNLEGYPNRDSLNYKTTYGINNAHTVLRGTLRFKRQFMTTLLGQRDDLMTSNVKNLIYERVDKCEFRTKAIEDLGLLDDIPVEKKDTPLDTLIFYLSNKLAYEPGERDLVIMRHDIGIQWHDEKKASDNFAADSLI
ncbi:hypothetical protein V5799_021969 [Amblyomma americanum]|uniref:Saccharopine dehydrogenase n=1 Tax=Amblyomma americanum TaxID=6943 RepID=A0AAQ4FNB2_AMBAM